MLSRNVTFEEFIRAAINGSDIDLITVQNYIAANHNDVDKINAPDPNDDTALSLAAYYGHASVVVALLAKIDDIRDLQHENFMGYTAEQEAVQRWGEDSEIATLIRARMVELEILSNNREEIRLKQQAVTAPTFAQQLQIIKDIYQSQNKEYKKEVPNHLKCPISLDIMTDPVTTSSSGVTYERRELEKYFLSKNNPNTVKCPMTNKVINKTDLNNGTNVTIKNLCEEYVECEKKAATLLTNIISSDSQIMSHVVQSNREKARRARLLFFDSQKNHSSITSVRYKPY